MIKKNYLPIFAVGFLLLPLTTAVAQENTEIRLLCDFRSNQTEYYDSGRVSNAPEKDKYVLIRSTGVDGASNYISVSVSPGVFEGSRINECLSD